MRYRSRCVYDGNVTYTHEAPTATESVNSDTLTLTVPVVPAMRAIRALALLRDTTGTHSAILGGIAVRAVSGAVTMLATDSYRMGAVTIVTEDSVTPTLDAAVIPSATVTTLCKTFSRSAVARLTGSLTVAVTGGAVAVTVGGYHHSEAIQLGRFPSVDHILAEVVEGHGRCQYDAAYLQSVGRVAREWGAPSVVVESSHDRKPSRFILTADDGPMMVLLMPQRMTE